MAIADASSDALIPKIQLNHLGKAFRHGDGFRWAIRGVTLTCNPGEFVSVIGPSGCGKTTILGMVAGLLHPTEGTVIFDGKELSGVNTGVGYVTQRDNLLPWRTVAGNVGLALELHGIQKAERGQMVDEMIKLVGLDGFANHYPKQLSGGMRKRASIARTLAYAKDTWLMDEPFAALDAQLKLTLQDELLRLWEQYRATAIYVTHDITEALALSDRVVVIGGRPGRIMHTVETGFERPRNIVHLASEPRFRDLYEELWSMLKPEAEGA